MQRQPENHQHDQHRADAVDDGAVLDGGEFFVGDRNRPGQPDPRAIFARKIEIAAACRIASVASLPGSSALKSRNGLTSMKRAAVGIGQRLVAGKFTPGEGAGPCVQDVLDGLGDQVERPLGAVELELSALEAGQRRFQRAGQPRMLGSPAMISISGAADSNCPVSLPDLGLGKEEQAVLLEELSGAELLDRLEMSAVGR